MHNFTKILGRGGMSVVYQYTEDKAIKVFREGIRVEDVEHEYDMSRVAWQLGMPTPEPFDMCEVGGQYAIVYQLIKGETLSETITRNPGNLKHYAKQLAELYRTLHTTIIDPDNTPVPNAHESTLKAIGRVKKFFGEEGTKKLENILNAIPQGNSFLHCDLHPRNVMVQDGQLMLIDVGDIGYGNPIIDIANVHALMTSGLLDFERFVGFPEKYARPFWDTVLNEYFVDVDFSKEKMNQLTTFSLIHCFTWLAVSEGLPQEVIDRFKGHFRRLLF